MRIWILLPFLTLCSFSPSIRSTQIPRPGKDNAVFFAVANYQNSKLTNLKNPISNARAIAGILNSRFGFDTLVIVNPTKQQIIDQLNELKRLYARNEDGKHPSESQLFLFFSGHGMSEDENGYFLPADSDPATPYNTGIAYEIWRPKINKINCRHILVAIDACYSVLFDSDWKNKTDGLFIRPGEMTDTQKALANYETYKARVFFTSDNKEDQTPDRSNFAKKLIEGLRSSPTRDGFLTSNQLFANYVEGATPTPRGGTFGDDEPSSAFLFYDINASIIDSTLTVISTDDDESAWENVKLMNSEESYNSYLKLFRKGKHRQEAQIALDSIQRSRLSKSFSPPDPFYQKMILVEGGVFEMGCDPGFDQICPDAELPQHKVRLGSFFIGKYEVTQADWLEITGEKPPSKNPFCADCPVVEVSWNMVQEFLIRLNARTSGKYRLPTEAEWEYAARGGAKSKGFPFSGGEDLDLIAWHDGNSGGIYHPVGQKMYNELLLYDMSGNVCEWCQDKWHENFKDAPSDGQSWIQNGTVGRVFRGGCWNRNYLRCNSSVRYWDYQHAKFDNVGFRLVRSI